VPASDAYALVVDHLTARYGSRPVLDGLSLRAERARLTAVLGPNGAGKTTLVRCCTGLLEPAGGTVRVLGEAPGSKPLASRVGLMPQSTGAWSGVRAGELLRYLAGLYAHPIDIDALISRFGITAYAKTAYRRLSGGQQQAVNLAGALLGRPELVFLDEPTAGMDPQARRGTWELVGQLRADGVSVVLTTHFLDEAEQLADTVVVIDSGRLVASGSPAELARSGAEGQIRFRAVSGLRLSSLVEALPLGTHALEESPGRYLVVGEVSPQLLASLTAWCASEGVLAEQLSVERRSLEDVFLELTGRELRA